jgi:Skp family chaperone for outer membrane proteins
MKKLFVMTCAVILSFTFFHAVASAQSLAIVDTNIIFEKSDHGKSIIEYFEKLQNDGIKQLEGLETKRKEAEEKKDDKLLQNIESEMQATAYELQTKIQNQQEILFNSVSEKLMQTIDTYRKSHDIDLILHTAEVASYDPKIDITNDIMKEFNNVAFDIQKELKKEEKK